MLVTLTFSMALTVTPTAAQPSEKPMAEALFQAGREHFERGEIEEACAKLDASRRIEPALGTVLHLADCYERIGRYASAWALFEEGASLAEAKGQAVRAEVAKLRAAALKPQLSWLLLAVEEGTPGLAIEISGVAVPASSWSEPIPVDPGSCTLAANAPSHEGYEHTITVSSEPTRTEVKIPALTPIPREPAPAAAPAAVKAQKPAPVPVNADFWNVQRIIGASLGGVGIGGIAAGAILGARAMVKNDSSLGECRPEDASRCTADGVRLRDAAEDHALASTIALSAGGALLGTGVIVFLTAGGDTTEATAWRLAPVIDGTSRGMTFGGTW